MAFFRTVAEQIEKAAINVGSDIAGFAANTVAPAVQGAGHGIAAGAVALADAATLGKIDELKGAKEDQEARAGKKFQQAEAGAQHILGKSNSSFNSWPGNCGPWMSKLPDSTKVVDLFLPGTHDSVARHGGDLAQTQQWSIQEQLQSGCRCFDLRFRMMGDNLCGYHGPVFQDINFGGVADQFEEFLQRNPKEVIFVNIQGEPPHESKRDLWELLQEKMTKRGKDKELWKPFSADLRTATLGELRKKIVAFDGAGSVVHKPDKQNEWEIGDADEKWGKVRAHATKTRQAKTLYINFLSAYAAHELTHNTPSGMAYRVNGKALSEVHTFKPGIYLIDYPGDELVKKLVARNG